MAEISYGPEVKILSIRMNKNKIADSGHRRQVRCRLHKKGKIVNIDVLETNSKRF